MTPQKTHWKKVFNSAFLSSADILQDTNLVIAFVRVEEVANNGKKELCNVAHFTERNIKPMILNVTNSKQVKKFANSNFLEDWQNIPITVYVAEHIKAFGEEVEGLRIRPTQPQPKPELKPETEQWMKAVSFLKEKGLTKIKSITDKYFISTENLKLLREQI